MSSLLACRRLRSLAVLGVFLLLALPIGCSDDPAAPQNDPDDGDGIHTDDGGVGVVIDTRPIFRKGYPVATVTLAFPGRSQFDTELDVDPTTNLAILDIDTDDLTAGELAAFAAGVAANIVAAGADESALATRDEGALVLDNSNTPLVMTTDLPFVPHTVALESDLPYLVQRVGADGVVAGQSGSSSRFDPDATYVIDDRSQQFFFTPVPDSDGMYTVASFTGYEWDALYAWGVVESGGTRVIVLDSDGVLPPAGFVLQQDEDGWVEMKISDAEEYLAFGALQPDGGRPLVLTAGDHDRFRLICDDITWSVTDRGTAFNQPIMTPAILDFAYKGELRNCSGATLEESVGKSEQRTRTTTVGTTESLQLFTSEVRTFGVEIGFSVTAKVGITLEGVGEAGEEATLSEQINVSDAFTTSRTQTSEQTWSRIVSTTEEVSRVRTLTLPPYTAVTVYDAVKTVEDVRVPFTQVLRITGTKKDGGRTLSGPEIRSQMLFNFVGGVIQAVGADYVDVGLRGFAVIDKLFQATTTVTEIEGACD